MSDPLTCSECGAPLLAGQGHQCPVCALQRALALSSNVAEVLTPVKPGDQIGRYKLLQQIGEGGFGSVFMAEQCEPIHRRVALKVLKLGMDTREVIARFEAERQALALMDHPSIAKVFDAGATDAGRPYFVMELVRGIKITAYCDECRLSTRERLNLFIQVCDAVQHAHQRGIIHRDLKPSNILVTQDGVPMPKIIDFGIAKATAAHLLPNETFATVFHQFLGTPSYMSPEQAGMSGLDIDTRSDIYALGVLLFELLTGCLPFDSKQLLQLGFDEVCRIIREHEPTKPSTRLSTLPAADLAAVAKHQGTEPPRLARLVRGDLDWIVMKCLEKDRARRYCSAEELARDVEHYLNHKPVTARRSSQLYRAHKFVRRHRADLATASALVLLLVAGVVVSAWQTVRATRAEAASRVEARFLVDMLQGVGPSVALGRDTKMLHEILDKTAERVGRDLTNQPQVEAELRSTLGNVYEELGDYAKADKMIRRALALRRAVFGEKHARVADSLNDLGTVLCDEGKLAGAERLFGQALAMRRELLGKEHLDVAVSLQSLGNAVLAQGKAAEAEVIFRQVVAMRRKLLGNENPLLAKSLGNLGTALWYQNKFSAAEAAYRETLGMQRKLLGDEHPDVATSLHNLARVFQAQFNLVEAESFCNQALEMRRKFLGAGHSGFASTLATLAEIYQGEGRFAEAETTQREALAIQRRNLGPWHPDAGVSLSNLGDILRVEGKLTEAETVQRQAVDVLKKGLGEHPLTAIALDILGNVFRDEDKLDKAEDSQSEALAMRRKLFGVEHLDLAQSLYDLANVRRAQGHLDEAERLHRDALAMRRQLVGNEHPDTIDSLGGLAALLQERGKLDEAQALMRECLPLAEKVLADDWRLFDARARLGGILLAEKRYAEAEPLLLAGYDGLKEREGKIPANSKHRLQEIAGELEQTADKHDG